MHLLLGHDIRVTLVENGETGNTEVLSARGSERNVVSSVVMNTSLAEHGVVLNLRLSERRAVSSNDCEFSCVTRKVHFPFLRDLSVDL